MKFNLNAGFSQLKKFNPGFKILDIFIFAAILVAGIFLTKASLTKKGTTVRVLADGNEYEYQMKDGIFKVEGAVGITTFQIEDGKVHIIDSPCPNKTCVEQGWTSPLICLPNKVIITIANYGDFDAVSE